MIITCTLSNSIHPHFIDLAISFHMLRPSSPSDEAQPVTPPSSRRRTRVRLGACAIVASSTLAAHAFPAHLEAQALTSITSLYVAYSSRKVSASPTGELKARLDSVDRDLGAALRLGQMSQIRRLLAKGNVLLAGRDWTAETDYNASLVLRGEKSVLESRTPATIRIEQLYAPSIELTRPLSARASLTSRVGVAPNARPTAVKVFGTFAGVSRDLREAPYVMELDVHDVADGRYSLAVDVLDSSRVLGTANLSVVVRAGLDETVHRLETAAATAPVALKSELLFPIDRMRKVNRGELELRTWDSERDFAVADSIRVMVAAKRDPFARRTGDMKRHYMLDSAREIMPYRLYVPKAYTAKTPMPIIVALHGLGSTEDTFFDAYGKKLPELAEQNGYILLSPLGYRVDGGYGSGVSAQTGNPAAQRSAMLSELDVMQALAQVRASYNVDANRMYLMGHSLGAIGTWQMAAKYPEYWAAIGMFSGQGAPSTMSLMKHIPQFVVHGDNDPTVNVRGSRTMVEAMKALNMDYQYIEVSGGNHTNVVEPNFGAMMTFFGTRRSAGTPRD